MLQKWIAAALVPLMLCGCRAKSNQPVPTFSESQEADSAVASALDNTSVWAVYWDTKTVQTELEAIPDGMLSAVCVFSALFNGDGSLYIHEQALALYEELSGTHADAPRMLTLVNDILYPDESSSQKDVPILEEKLRSPETRRSHIAEIIGLAKAYGFVGVELDYEGVRRWGSALTAQYVQFCGELWQAAESEGLELRIILEPSFPVADYTMPEGPAYMVMLYNLYGYGTGPGPKADTAFLKTCAETFADLPGPVIWAMATGGFDWTNGGSPAAVTELAAIARAASAHAQRRDENSGCVVVQYRDDAGTEHEMWYADGETLRFWANTLRRYGGAEKFALWRLGGNDPESLRRFFEAADPV